MAADIVGVFINDVEVVIDIASLRRDLASSGCHGTDRVDVTGCPADLVDAVDGLLGQAVSGEPAEIIPVLPAS